MKTLRLVLGALILFGLAACETPQQPTTTITQPVYGAPIKLDVAAIEVQRGFSTAGWAAAEQSFADKLLDGVDTWARTRLVAVGRTGSAKVIVQNASVGERVLRRQNSATTMERVKQYDGVVSVKIDAIDRATMRTGFADATVSRSRTMPIKTSVAKRNRTWNDMAYDMLKELDSTLGAIVKKRMPRLIK